MKTFKRRQYTFTSTERTDQLAVVKDNLAIGRIIVIDGAKQRFTFDMTDGSRHTTDYAAPETAARNLEEETINGPKRLAREVAFNERRAQTAVMREYIRTQYKDYYESIPAFVVLHGRTFELQIEILDQGKTGDPQQDRCHSILCITIWDVTPDMPTFRFSHCPADEDPQRRSLGMLISYVGSPGKFCPHSHVTSTLSNDNQTTLEHAIEYLWAVDNFFDARTHRSVSAYSWIVWNAINDGMVMNSPEMFKHLTFTLPDFHPHATYNVFKFGVFDSSDKPPFSYRFRRIDASNDAYNLDVKYTTEHDLKRRYEVNAYFIVTKTGRIVKTIGEGKLWFFH